MVEKHPNPDLNMKFQLFSLYQANTLLCRYLTGGPLILKRFLGCHEAEAELQMNLWGPHSLPQPVVLTRGTPFPHPHVLPHL